MWRWKWDKWSRFWKDVGRKGHAGGTYMWKRRSLYCFQETETYLFKVNIIYDYAEWLLESNGK